MFVLHRFDTRPQDVELCLRVALLSMYRQNIKKCEFPKDRRKYRKLVEQHCKVVATLDTGNWLNSLAMAYINEDQAAKVKVHLHI